LVLRVSQRTKRFDGSTIEPARAILSVDERKHEMKAFYVMFVVFAVLLFAAPMASAQAGGPSCPGGSAYDLTGHGCVTGYVNGPTAAKSIAAKAPGLAAPAQAEKQAQGLSGCPWGYDYDPIAHGDIWECMSRPADNAASLKPAGLAKLAPAEVFVPCGAGEQLDPLLDPEALACLSGPVTAAKAASKPAGLAAPAAAVIPDQSWPGCPWGATYDPTKHGFIAECFFRPADNAVALKPAGLAKLAPAEEFIPCGAGEQFDPLLDPQALACLSGPVTAAKAASKPAGLAQLAPAADPEQGLCPWGDRVALAGPNYVPECNGKNNATYAAPKAAGLAAPAPVVDPMQGLPCLPWGDAYDPMTMLSHGPECLSRPADNAAALKPAGLAKLAPVEAFVPCGFGERLDPLALACLSGPDSAAKAASKPAGLATPAQEISSSLCDAGESPNRCP
jgi:hypothetical protein